MKLASVISLILTFSLSNILQVRSHGRLIEPPNRSSLWRFKEFESQNPPQNYNDMELFCGGAQVQNFKNDGRCGLCGDNWADQRPRANEDGGTYGRGIKARTYKSGSTIKVGIDLTQSHKGYFEFRLCPRNPGEPETENCFNQHLLKLADGSGTKFPIRDFNTGWYNTSVKLPLGAKGSKSVFQWHYRGGNNWGDCGNGTEELGCGPQEHFVNCADIAIE